MMHICVSKLTIIGADNGLSPGRCQAIIWTNAGILLIGPLGTNFSEILISIETFSFKKKHLKISSAKWRLFRLDLNELKTQCILHNQLVNSKYISMTNAVHNYMIFHTRSTWWECFNKSMHSHQSSRWQIWFKFHNIANTIAYFPI